MKKNTILATTLPLPFFLFCQKPFVPLGAQWGTVSQCSPTFWPCPPNYPIFSDTQVTEDTIIQGKYCTVINERDWDSGSENAIVHQDGYQIFRYDRTDEDFKLVLDFSKEVGESWQIEVPDFWAGTDTFTITVNAKDSTFRSVSIDVGFQIFTDLPLYENFGGLVHNKRLLVGNEFFVTLDPILWDELTCYIDPTEGLLYGHAFRCNTTTTSNPVPDEAEYTVYPNPAFSHITLDSKYPLTKPAEWSLSNTLGQVVRTQAMATGTETYTLTIDDLTPGIYCWTVQIEGSIVEAGRVIVGK